MEGNLFKISIVIPAFNCSSSIEKAISAGLTQQYPQEQLEIIVVDDGSFDNTAQKIRQFNQVKYIYQPNSGAAKARNTGWRNATGEIICFTDADCVPGKEWVDKIVRRYNSQEIAAVGGSYDIANQGSILAKCIHEEIMQRHLKMPQVCDHLASFNLSFRRRVLEETGGFDESFKAASAEDNELSYRLKKKGYKLIFDKDIEVAHYHKTRLFSYLKQQFRHGYWCMKLYRMHPDMMRGDNYAGLIDYIQPPLSLLFTGSLVLSLFSPQLFILFSAPLLLLLLLLNVPMSLAIVRRKRQKIYLIFALIAFLRSLSRSIGMTSGVFRFFILDSLSVRNNEIS